MVQKKKFFGGIFMKAIRVLSVIGLAIYLVLQGLYFLTERQSLWLHNTIGVVALATGVLIFISLSHWINIRKEK